MAYNNSNFFILAAGFEFKASAYASTFVRQAAYHAFKGVYYIFKAKNNPNYFIPVGGFEFKASACASTFMRQAPNHVFIGAYHIF
jgi:hypothetical protein